MRFLNKEDEKNKDNKIQIEHMKRTFIENKDLNENLNSANKRNKFTQKKKKRNPKISTWSSVDEEIDLHGKEAEEAAHEVEEFIKTMLKSEGETLRIVHGGRIANYGSVKKALDKLLREKLKKHISKYFLEEKNEGSSIVILKKQEHKKNIPKKLR